MKTYRRIDKMDHWLTLMRVATLVNIALLVGLSSIWVRNYLQLRTTFLLGILTFGGFLLAENVYAFYIYVVNPETSQWLAGVPEHYTAILMVPTILQLGGLLALAWTTRA